MPGIYECEIMAQTEVSPAVFRTVLKGTAIARDSQPGQFVNAKVSEGLDPLLRRPFSVHAVYPNEGVFSLLYVVRGRGTELLKKMHAGDKVSVVGPLGKPFDLGDDPEAQHIVIAGGCGAAPLHLLCDALCKKWDCSRVTVLSGAQSKDAVLCEAEFKAHGVEVGISTDDGSYGYHGLVTQLLEQHLVASDACNRSNKPATSSLAASAACNRSNKTSDIRVYSSGPHAMLREVARICGEAGVASCQVSLENHMACGMGVCMGCVQKIKRRACVGANGLPTHSEQWRYERVCADGPVFEAEDVIWD